MNFPEPVLPDPFPRVFQSENAGQQRLRDPLSRPAPVSDASPARLPCSTGHPPPRRGPGRAASRASPAQSGALTGLAAMRQSRAVGTPCACYAPQMPPAQPCLGPGNRKGRS